MLMYPAERLGRSRETNMDAELGLVVGAWVVGVVGFRVGVPLGVDVVGVRDGALEDGDAVGFRDGVPLGLDDVGERDGTLVDGDKDGD